MCGRCESANPSESRHTCHSHRLDIQRYVHLVGNNLQIVSKTFGDKRDAPPDHWAGTFERYWHHQLNQVKVIAEATVSNGALRLTLHTRIKLQNLKEK
jgi:hypothetical protein